MGMSAALLAWESDTQYNTSDALVTSHLAPSDGMAPMQLSMHAAESYITFIYMRAVII